MGEPVQPHNPNSHHTKIAAAEQEHSFFSEMKRLGFDCADISAEAGVEGVEGERGPLALVRMVLRQPSWSSGSGGGGGRARV